MTKTKRTRLTLDRDTIRRLATRDLEVARGAGSQLQTCSLCGGVLGCATGASCPG